MSQFEQRRTQVASQHRSLLAARLVREDRHLPGEASTSRTCTAVTFPPFFLSSAINSCPHTVSILLFLPLQMDTKSNTQPNSFTRYYVIARIMYLSPEDLTQAACHFAQRQLQKKYFVAALLHAARCCFAQTRAVTKVCLSLLLCTVRTKHSAAGRIF